MRNCLGKIKPSTLRSITRMITNMDGMLKSADRMLNSLDKIEDSIISQEESVSQTELSVNLGVTVKTIISWRNKGYIPFEKIRNRFYYVIPSVKKAMKKKLITIS